jgi:isoamylase
VRGLSLSRLLQTAQLDWHGVRLKEPDWGFNSHSLAFTVRGRQRLFHVILNAYWKELDFELPPTAGHDLAPWQRIIDTALESPADFCRIDDAPYIESEKYTVSPRSIVALVSKSKNETT